MDRSTADRPPVDLARLEEVVGDDPAFIDELLQTFVSSALEVLGWLRTGVAEGDATAVERAAHRLKGASANVGAEGLREQASELELLGRSGSLDGARVFLEGLEREYLRVREFLAARERGV